MQSAYEVDAEGRVRVSLPRRCPLGADGSPCRVWLHDRRVRKTGPRIALVVARCQTHGRSFTVYPPGHVPYGRAAVVPVDLGGRTVRDGSGELAFGGTMFEAALDAAADHRWPRSGGVEPGTRRTQGRWLGRANSLLGLDPATPERGREQIAAVLSVPLLTLHELPRQSWRAGGSWTERGRQIVRVLHEMREPARLLLAGEVGGLWGRPSRWDPGGPGLLRPLF